MTRNFVFAALILGGAATAFAMTDMDSDGDGALSVTEFLEGYPTLTAAEFDAADTNADGLLDADEIAAAVTSGLLPADRG
ncbi:MAG: EF-hand domain-containing protein [Pseudomonadota bacterium]